MNWPGSLGHVRVSGAPGGTTLPARRRTAKRARPARAAAAPRRTALAAAVLALGSALAPAEAAPRTAGAGADVGATVASTTAEAGVGGGAVAPGFDSPVRQRAARLGIRIAGSTPSCTTAPAGHARCHARLATDPSGRIIESIDPIGYTPAELQVAYHLPLSAANGRRPIALNRLGHKHVVAIVTAYDNPNVESDLAVYRAAFGLPPCTAATECFRKVNQDGQEGDYPRPDPAWAAETALDTQMVSAICPACQIVVVEARSNRLGDLAAAVRTARRMGATEITNSYGASEYSGQMQYESEYTSYGVPITASAGDDGYGVQYPAASLGVTAVGGTSLFTDPGSERGWRETVWRGTGSGCSAYVRKPGWQTDTGCPRRTVADLAVVADPNTGVAVYETYRSSGWVIAGGTSVGAPIVAAIWALNGGGSSFSFPAGATWLNDTWFYDVTSGSNGTCSPSYLCRAGEGFDGPTGLGTPDGVGAFGGPIN